MGKIIEFSIKKTIPDHLPHTEGIKLYYKYYKTAGSAEQEWTLQTIGLDLVNSFKNREYLDATTPQEMLELIGYAAAKRKLKTPKVTSKYYRKLAEILEKYGRELMEIAETN